MPRRRRTAGRPVDLSILLVAWCLAWAIAAPWYVASYKFDFVAAKPSDPALAKAQLWFFLVSAQAVVWALAVVLLGWACWTIGTAHFRARPSKALPAVLTAVLLALVLWLYNRAAGDAMRPRRVAHIDLNHNPSFAAVGIVIAFCAVAGMFLVRTALLERARASTIDVASYGFLKARMQTFLSVAAAILSLGVVGSAALRAAVNATGGPNYFPAEYVFLYGGIFTLLLLVAYVPVKLAFWQAGTHLARQAMGDPPAHSSELAKWMDDKAKLDKALDLDLTTPSALLGPVAALLPLLAGWVTALLAGPKP